MLDQVSKGIKQVPYLLTLYGVAGVGKTTTASQSEKPIFLGGEDGSFNLDVSRFPKVTVWDQFEKALEDLYKERHDYKTLVIDTIDSLEPIMWQKICKDSNAHSIELACGGYGKAFTKEAEMWVSVRNVLDKLRLEKGMNIILLAHSQSTKFFEPLFQIEYDRYEMKLNKKSVPVFVEWTDNLLFANFQTFKSVNKDGNELAVSTGNRKLYTVETPAYKAKNRFSLPPEMDMNFNEFKSKIDDFYKRSGSNIDIDLIRQEIQILIDFMPENLRPTIQDSFNKAKDDIKTLISIKNRLQELKGVK